MQQRVILFLLQLFHLSFDLCLPAGLSGTRHSTGMLYEKSNEIKIIPVREGRYERERGIFVRALWHLLFNDRGDVCRDNYFLENRKDIIEI